MSGSLPTISAGRAATLLACALATALTAQARAQNVDEEVEVPLRTSTIDAGQPGDIVITSDGSVDLLGAPNTVVVTIDSNNSLDNEGSIVNADADNTVGVLINGELSGGIRNAGSIILTEDYTREDLDGDDDLDGPLAIGAERVGVLLDDAGPFVGDIVNDAGGVINVEGDQSAGVRLNSRLVGDLINDGSISVLGEDAVGVEIRDGIAGDARFAGPVTVQGENAVAVSVRGPIDGALTIENGLSATGFTSTSVSNYADPDDLTEDDTPIADRRDADDLLSGGPTLAIGDDIDSGLLVNGPIDRLITDADLDDEVKDTIEDFDVNRPTGAISNFGGGQAILISPDWNAAGAGDLVIGPVTETVRDTQDDDEDENFTEVIATFDYDYSFINRGNITSNGLNIGFDATAVEIRGSADGARQAILSGGIQNIDDITADAFEANAIAIHLGDGAVVPRIDNAGVIDADVFTETTNTAHAILIEDGASISQIRNFGTISASARGDAGRPVAIEDASGTLRLIENSSLIAAEFIDDGDDEDAAGPAIAIDAAGHGSGENLTVRQFRQTPSEDVNGDGVLDADDVDEPEIRGDIVFGAGDDSLLIEGGLVTGDIVFGAGADTFRITSGSEFAGAVRDADGQLNVEILASDVTFSASESLAVTSFTVDGASRLGFDLSAGADQASPVIAASSPARIGPGVDIDARLDSFVNAPITVDLIQSPDLEVAGDVLIGAEEDAPYIYNTVFSADETTLSVAFDPKTAEDLGLNPNESAAYPSVLQIFEDDEDLGAALVALTTEDEFNSAYSQVLSITSDGALRFTAAQNAIGSGPLSHRLTTLRSLQPTSATVWGQQSWTYTESEGRFDRAGYDGLGFSFVAGVDRPVGRSSILGAALAFEANEFKEDADDLNEVSSNAIRLMAYGTSSFLGFAVDAAATAAWLDFGSVRGLDFADLSEEIEGSWNGHSFTAGARVTYPAAVGPIELAPSVSIDYASVTQSAYTERASDTQSVALSIGRAHSSLLNAAAVLRVGRRIDSGLRDNAARAAFGWRSGDGPALAPEIYAGVRTNVSYDPYAATASFVGSEQPFQLQSLEDFGSAAIGGAALRVYDATFLFSANYDVAIEDRAMEHQLGVTFRFSF